MKNRILSILLVIVMLLPLTLTVHAEGTDIVVLFTNDVHSAIDGYASLAAYRAELISKGNDVFTVDVGDAIQGETIGTLTEGEAVVELMNSVGYDYAVPGNHEFDYGMDVFLDIAQSKANYKYLSSNFYYMPSVSPKLDTYAIEEANGLRIAFVGISTPETITKANPTYFKDENNNFIYGFPAYEMTNELLYSTVQESVDAAKAEGADVVIAMGHMGIAETTDGWKSTDVIANTNGIDFFLDAHSHETIETATYTNKDGEAVILASTGTKLTNIGVLTINGDGEGSVQLVSTDSVDASAMSSQAQTAYSDVKGKIDLYNEEMSYLLDPIGTSEVDLVAYDTDSTWLVRKRETNAGDFVADAYRAVTGADIAVSNGGGIRSEIAVGDVSRKSLMDMNPWSNPMCVLEVTGAQVLDVLEHGARNCPEALGGFFQVSGLTYQINVAVESPVITNEYGDFISVDETKERRVSDVTVNGEAIESDKTYTIAGSKYVLMEGGDGLTMLSGATVVQDEGLPCDSEMLIKYFTETLGGVIPASLYGNPEGDGRITIPTFAENGCTIEPGDTITIRAPHMELDEGFVVNFTPVKSGNYYLKSISDCDPICYLFQDDTHIMDSDDEIGRDFLAEYYFEEGETYSFNIFVYGSEIETIKVYLGCVHNMEDGICTQCGGVCDHTEMWDLGYCSCGAKYIGEVIDNENSFTANVSVPSGEYAWFEFSPTAGGDYLFTSASAEGADPYCYIFDADGNELLRADDFDESFDFKGVYTFEAGKTYYFMFGDYNADDAFEFELKRMEQKLGDANNDGFVDNLDSVLMLKYDAGLTELNSSQAEAADVNMDGIVDNMDAVLVLKYDAGIIDSII